MCESLESDAALREGLRAIPVPTPSEDFDARVLAALQPPAPWWVTIRLALRPLLAGAACSIVVTLLAVQWTFATSAPQSTVPGPPSAAAVAIDDALDQNVLTAGALNRLAVPRLARRIEPEAAAQPQPPAAAPNRPDQSRRAAPDAPHTV